MSYFITKLRNWLNSHGGIHGDKSWCAYTNCYEQDGRNLIRLNIDFLKFHTEDEPSVFSSEIDTMLDVMQGKTPNPYSYYKWAILDDNEKKVSKIIQELVSLNYPPLIKTSMFKTC